MRGNGCGILPARIFSGGKRFLATNGIFVKLLLVLLCNLSAINFAMSVFAATYSLSLSTSGTVDVDVAVTGSGVAVGSDELVVNSTCPHGYTITIVGPADGNLYRDGDSNNNESNEKIIPSSGTVQNPVTVSGNNRGTWGYSLTSNDGTGTFIGLNASATTLATKNTASGDGTVLTDTIPVYFGVSTRPDQLAGLYKFSNNATINYFITTPYNCTSYDIVFNPTSIQDGETISGTGTMDDQTITEDVPTALSADAFTPPTGYSFDGWNTAADGTGVSYADQEEVTNLTAANTAITLYAKWKADTYTITLDGNGATMAGSNSTIATYNSTALSNITVPRRSYTISGFTTPSSNNANGATVSSATTLTSDYTFNGWYKEASATNKIANNATTPVLEANTDYTNVNGKWNEVVSGIATLFAGWTTQAKTLPTITKTGYTCGWTTAATSATTITYESGASFIPSSNTVLYGVCTAKTYTITLEKNGGAGGSNSATVKYDATTISNITNPTRANTTGTRTVSGFTLTTSGTNATVSSNSTLNSTNTTTYTFNGWYKEAAATTLVASNSTTPALTASNGYTNSSKQWNYDGGVALYAGWAASAGAYSAVTLPTITRTGSTCGWSTSSTATTITYESGASFTPSTNTVLYGVCVTNISLNRNGGNTGSTSATVNYGATTLSSITVPTKANTAGTRTVSGFTKTTSATNSTVSSTTTLNSTNTTTYTFNGWYKEAGATNKIANTAASPALEASTTYTNSSKQWTYTTAGTITLYAGWTASAGAYSAVTLPTITRTGSTCGWATSNSATTWSYNSGASITPSSSLTLYGVCRNNISLSNNGATTAGSTSATVNYNATTLSAITLPQRKYTVSGFTKGTNAGSATISSTATLTNTATFKGWYTASSGGTLIASSAATPALQANTTYTNSSKQWTYTTANGVTLYSQWTDNAVTLPTIKLSGYTCGWNTSSTATTIAYASGASIIPTSNLTLYGICTINTYSLTITFAGSGVSSVQVRTAAGTGGTLKGTVSSSGGSVSGLTYNTAYYLYPTYTDTNHGLNSWAKTSTAGTLSSTSAANPTFTIGAGNGAVTITGKQLMTYIQDFTKSMCQSQASSAAVTVLDIRDNNTYTVRYINNNCWMTTNLKLGKSTTMALTSDTSNVPASGYTLPAISTSWGTGDQSVQRIYTSNRTTCSSTSNCYGYYSYPAATAGTNPSSGDASYDICPKGWRLPTRTEYTNLANTYNTRAKITAAPFSGVYNGVYFGNSVDYSGETGFYWSATTNSQYMAYGFRFGVMRDYIWEPAMTTENKYGGRGIRCIAK